MTAKADTQHDTSLGGHDDDDDDDDATGGELNSSSSDMSGQDDDDGRGADDDSTANSDLDECSEANINSCGIYHNIMEECVLCLLVIFNLFSAVQEAACCLANERSWHHIRAQLQCM